MDIQKERMFAEKLGVAFEQFGLPRMAGRIFGWLLIAETPQVSMGALIEALQASKSSVSTMLRLLIQIGLVELVSLPGERRGYYRVHPDAWSMSLRERLAQAHAFRQLAEEGLDLLAGTSPERRARLETMHGMYALLERELPGLIETWEEERKQFEP